MEKEKRVKVSIELDEYTLQQITDIAEFEGKSLQKKLEDILEEHNYYYSNEDFVLWHIERDKDKPKKYLSEEEFWEHRRAFQKSIGLEVSKKAKTS